MGGVVNCYVAIMWQLVVRLKGFVTGLRIGFSI